MMSITEKPDEGILIDVRPHGANRAMVRGPLEVYYGTRTREKRAQHGYVIKGSGSGVRALQDLQTVLAWSRWDPAISELIDHCSETRGGGRLSELREVLGGMVGGDSGHRFSGSLGDRDAYINGTATFSSHCRIDTDHCLLSATEQDYPVMFQEFMLYLISVAEYRARRVSSTTPLSGRLTFDGYKLEPLSGLTLSTTGPSVELPPVETPRLLRAKDPRLMRTGGCWWGGSIALKEVSRNEVVFQALVAEFRHSIRSSRGGTGHLEGGLQIRTFRFGFLEVLNAGMSYVLDAAAIAVIEAGNELIHSRLNRKRFNHSTGLLLKTYGMPIVRALVPFALHPQMSDDPLIIRSNILPGPSYFSGLSPTAGLITELMARITSFISDPNSLYYTTPTVCFGSDAGPATSDAELRLLRKEVSRAAITGMISYDEANFLVGSTIKRMVPVVGSSEEESLLSLATILSRYDVYKRGTLAVSEVGAEICRTIAQGAPGHQVLGVNLSSEEIVRELRTVRRRPPGKRARPREMLRADSTDLVWTTVPQVDHQLPRAVENALTTYARHVGHTGLLGSTSVFVWGSLGHLFKGKHVVVIGSGLGGTALAASVSLAASISGLDLCSDFGSELNLRSYVPPLLKKFGGHVRYAQCSETVIAGGVWSHPLVHGPILRNLRSDSILVLDIPMTDGLGSENLGPILESLTSATCLIRLRGSSITLATSLSLVRRKFDILGHYRFDPSPDARDVVFLARPNATTDVPSTRVAYLAPMTTFFSPIDESEADFYVALVCAPLGGPTGGTVRDCLRTYVRMVIDAKGGGVVRPSYSEWSDVLVSFVVCELLLLYTEADLGAAVLRIIATERFVSAIIDNLQVIVSSRLRWMITRVVPGLSTHLEDITLTYSSSSE